MTSPENLARRRPNTAADSYQNLDQLSYLNLPNKSTGVAIRGLCVHVVSRARLFQPDFANTVKSFVRCLTKLATGSNQRITILEDFNGLIEEGQSLLVLGRPGSGCSTVLKSISGRTRGLEIDNESAINYQGRLLCLFKNG